MVALQNEESDVGIQDKSVVAIHYKLTNEAGEELDASQPDQPLVYMHGSQSIIPGLESALAGKDAGERLQVSIAPENAYGESDPDLIQAVPRSVFEGVDEIEPGMQFSAQSDEGPSHAVTVREVSDEEVTIDGNHPLAGVALHFDVLIESVREATAEEMEHGHAHGPGDEHH